MIEGFRCSVKSRLHSSGMLRSVDWSLVTDVKIVPISCPETSVTTNQRCITFHIKAGGACGNACAFKLSHCSHCRICVVSTGVPPRMLFICSGVRVLEVKRQFSR